MWREFANRSLCFRLSDSLPEQFCRLPSIESLDVALNMPQKAELVVEDRKIQVSNLDKVLYPKVGFAKGQVIDYFIRIAPVLLPHLRDRPLTMKRYPNGVEGEFFYEKNCPSHRPKWVQTAKVWSEGNQRIMHYCLANDLPTLVWAANLADLELHTSLSRKNNIARPTMMVFDLDPGAPGRHRPMLPGRDMASRFVRQNETEIVCQNEWIERTADLRAAEYVGDLRPNQGFVAALSPNILSVNMGI